jgi:hypothetical protein
LSARATQMLRNSRLNAHIASDPMYFSGSAPRPGTAPKGNDFTNEAGRQPTEQYLRTIVAIRQS